MYMRLCGYPAEKITILTTYNGQKHLLRDVVEQRCASNPFIGRPHKITTVDKFQGQQNDYILLSLVRTKTVGHIRDIRRLTVAISRARLGFYIFARENLFSSCYELQRTFGLLNKRSNKLELLPHESYSQLESLDRSRVKKDSIHAVSDMPSMLEFVFDFYKQQVERLKNEKPEVFESIVNPQASNQEESEEMETVESTAAATAATEEEEIPFEKLTEEDTGIEDEIEVPEVDDEQDKPMLSLDDFET